jgi:hypothetical protein
LNIDVTGTGRINRGFIEVSSQFQDFSTEAEEHERLKIRRKIRIASTVTRKVRIGEGAAALCLVCRRVAEHVGRSEAVRMVGAPALDRWLASGEVHCVEGLTAGAMICRDSLIRAKERMES